MNSRSVKKMDGGRSIRRSSRRSGHSSTRLLGHCLVGLTLLATAAGAPAQESSEGFTSKLLIENEHIRAVENGFQPGAASPFHTHASPRLVYVVEGGTVELQPAAGEPVRVELTTGQSLWRPAESHSVRNVGSTHVKVIEVEIKAAPRSQHM